MECQVFVFKRLSELDMNLKEQIVKEKYLDVRSQRRKWEFRTAVAEFRWVWKLF